MRKVYFEYWQIISDFVIKIKKVNIDWMRMWQDVNGREYNIVIKFKKFGRRHQSTLHMESFYLDIKNTSYPIRNKTLISDFTRLIVPNNSITMFEVSFEF